jgi:predicted nucleotidyltransferase
MAERGVLDLSTSDLAIVRGILQRLVPGRPVFVFGSRVTGRARRRSDIDLAIGGTEPMSLLLRAELADAFDESDLPIEVDVVDLATVSETFRNRITAEWVELERAASVLRSQREVHV